MQRQGYPFGALQDPSAPGGVGEIPARQVRIFSNYLYSTVQFPAGVPVPAGRNALFVTALNQAGQGYPAMSALETNLRSGGRVPDGESWTISHMGAFLRPNSNLDDIATIISSVSIVFSKRTYEQLMGPFFFWPGGIGITGVAATTQPATQFVYGQNGVAAPSAMTRLPTPIELASGETFTVFLDVINGFNPQQDAHVGIRFYGRFAEVVPS